MSAYRRLSVAVVGGGIGGLTTAVALHQRGIHADVYEQADVMTDAGNGLAISANSSRLLTRLGLSNGLRKRSVGLAHADFISWTTGELLARHQLGDHYKNLFGYPYYALHRTDLADLLLSACEPNTIHWGMRCLDIIEKPDCVEIHFADGSSAEADLAVGADGIRSATLLGTKFARPLIHSGVFAVRGFAAPDQIPRHVWNSLSDCMRLTVGPGCMMVGYPVRAGEIYNFVLFLSGTGWPEETQVREVSEICAILPTESSTVNAILQASGPLISRPVKDRRPLKSWSTRRKTLIGDAAHAMLPYQGQGANQAIEDAYALAAHLAETGADNLQPALKSYEAMRHNRTRRVQMASRMAGTLMMREDAAHTNEMKLKLSRLQQDLAWIHGYDLVRACEEGAKIL
nr:FAD-dependent monooxygenase [Streptomyces chartreusis]